MNDDQELSGVLERWRLEKYLPLLTEHAVDLDVLRMLSDRDLQTLDIPRGDRKRFHAAVAAVEAEQTKDGERRRVTVFFCDIVGFSRMAEELDPEDLEDRVERFVTHCTKRVQDHGGHVANFLGDGLLVYFGWPQAYQAAADQAVHAALSIIATTPQLSTDADRARDTHLEARIGIATGMVLIGKRLGQNPKLVGKVFGSTPNIAARLQSMAEPGEILIADTTKKTLTETFHLLDRGALTLRGHKEPVSAWQVQKVDPWL